MIGEWLKQLWAEAAHGTITLEEQHAEDEAPIVGTLYIQKHFAKGNTRFKVTIEAVD